MRKLCNLIAEALLNPLIKMYNAFVLGIVACKKVLGMKHFVGLLILLLLSIPTGINATQSLGPPRAQPQKQALLMSSLNQTVPMGRYYPNMLYYLNNAGYNVTYLTDSAVTIDFLLNNLNSYSVIIWRTNTFNWVHTNYWYVGEKINSVTEQKYASDFASGWLNDKTGIFGVSMDWINNHFRPNTLTGVKLLIFMASYGNSIAPTFLNAGVSSVIFCNGVISLQFGLIDDLTTQMVSYLAAGQSVNAAVYETVSPFNQGQQPKDNLDTTYAPPFWFIGNDTLTIV